MSNKKWIATIAGDPNRETIKIGITGNKKTGYEVILSNGDESAIALQKTYEDAEQAIISSWGYSGNPWNFEIIE